MELDDLKTTWSHYSEKLNKTLSINEEILRNMNLEKSKKELNTPIFYEVSSVVITSLTALYTGVISFQHFSEPQFSIPGLIGTVLCLIYLLMAISKLKAFLNIEHYNDSLIKTQKKLQGLNQLVLKYRKFELLLITPLSIGLIPILFISLYGINVYEDTKWFWGELAAILIVVFPLTVWINKYFYDRKLKNVVHFIKEINEFQTE